MMPATGKLRILSPGLDTRVVDAGRPRTRSLGVPVGGAADRFSLAIGNALVDNDPDVAALEITLVGPTLVADVPLACVLYGAPFELSIDGRRREPGTTFTLEPGQVLHIGGTPRRMRAYLCVQGGLGGVDVLGSRSSLTALSAGAELPCQAGRIGGRTVRIAEPGGEDFLHLLPGPQADWFPVGALSGRRLTVTPASNRMGLRLRGDPLPVPTREMLSEPVCPGSVQVTRDGQCIVLGVDGQTIGGYPRIAQVIAADLDWLGQLRPGSSLTVTEVTLAEAEERYEQRQNERRGWLRRLRMG